MERIIGLLGFMTLLVIMGCDNERLDYNTNVVVNPHGLAPLTAEIYIETSSAISTTATVLGRFPIVCESRLESKNNIVEVVGLYPGEINNIALKINHPRGTFHDTISIYIDSLPYYFPKIEIEKLDLTKMEPGLHFCDTHFAQDGKFYTIPFLFDNEEKVRWFLDLSQFNHALMPIGQLANGNLCVIDNNVILEFNMLGALVNKTKMNDVYTAHHEWVELPNGNLLIAVSKSGTKILLDGIYQSSSQDYIVLYDRGAQQVVKEWDLAEVLDVSRDDLIHIGGQGNWLHMNGLAFNFQDSTIIVSSKHQGVVKIDWNNKLKWILGPKKNWGLAGRQGKGLNTNKYLLTAVDSNYIPYNIEVQRGNHSLDNFDFPWGQHAPELLPNGNLLLFDNGYLRNFSVTPNYSRAVEYEIDDNNMLVRQKWQFGKERNRDFYSLIISDVDFLPKSGHVLISAGYLNYKGVHSAKIVEINPRDNEIFFEATLYFKDLNGDNSFAWAQFDILYRSERVKLIN